MNAIIVNPMPEARKHLSKLLRIFCQNVTIVDCADNAIDGIELVKTLDPDLIFIDVKVFNKENCSLTNNYLSEKVHTVFTLNNIDQLAKIGLDSADYLLTPTNPESLTKCVQRAHLKLRKQLFPNFKATSKDKTERIGIPTSKGIKYIALGEIIYLKAHNNYTEIFQEKRKAHINS